MFFEEAKINSLLQPYNIEGNFVRNVLIISCMCIYFLGLIVTLFVFFQRKMYWIEAIVIANIMPGLRHLFLLFSGMPDYKMIAKELY